MPLWPVTHFNVFTEHINSSVFFSLILACRKLRQKKSLGPLYKTARYDGMKCRRHTNAGQTYDLYVDEVHVKKKKRKCIVNFIAYSVVVCMTARRMTALCCTVNERHQNKNTKFERTKAKCPRVKKKRSNWRTKTKNQRQQKVFTIKYALLR